MEAGVVAVTFLGTILALLFAPKRQTKKRWGGSSRFFSSYRAVPRATPGEFPYNKKQYLMTYAEHDFFRTLQRAVGDKYYIFPQVHYSKIVYANGRQDFYNPYLNKIDRKSADFVLFNREHVSPVLVIEKEDKFHKLPERIERDQFIDKVLQKCGIPIIHARSFATETELKAQIASKIRL